MAATPAPAAGSKRLVVGAHYGVGGYLMQRLTAVVLTAYVLLLVVCIVAAGDLNYENWASLFVPLWMKIVTLVALIALLYHAWIGVRDIWMDYVKPTWIRLSLQTVTVLWLVCCAVWSVQILWRV